MSATKEKAKTGRPLKATAQELEWIIHLFASKYPEAIGERNIASRLEKFVKEQGLTVESGKPLCATDFRRDDVRAMIKSMIHKRKDRPKKITIPALEPLDIEAVVSMSMHRQIEVLQQREMLYKDLHSNASIAIELWKAESAKRDARENKLRNAEQALAQQKAECQDLKQANRNLEIENRRLRQYLRDVLAPEQAKNFLEGLKEKNQEGTVFAETAVLDITAFIKSDVRKSMEVEIEDPTSLDDLF